MHYATVEQAGAMNVKFQLYKLPGLLLVAVCVLFLQVAFADQELSADEIVQRSDKVRNPDGSYRVRADITEYKNGKVNDRMAVLVHSKPDDQSGMYRTIVEIRKPAKDRGKIILRNSQDLWFFDPASKASVRISPQQRLLGQVSNGDVMSTNFALDYQSRLDGEETIRDANKEEQLCYRLTLNATNDRVTYPKIEYWVARDSFYPIKGKFYASSGRLLKIAYYRSFQTQLDSVRPTEVLILDAVDKKMITRMSFADYEYLDIPDFWFQRSWLPRHVSR
jgi:hypothetical protein